MKRHPYEYESFLLALCCFSMTTYACKQMNLQDNFHEILDANKSDNSLKYSFEHNNGRINDFLRYFHNHVDID